MAWHGIMLAGRGEGEEEVMRVMRFSALGTSTAHPHSAARTVPQPALIGGGGGGGGGVICGGIMLRCGLGWIML